VFIVIARGIVSRHPVGAIRVGDIAGAKARGDDQGKKGEPQAGEGTRGGGISFHDFKFHIGRVITIGV
jgi:hypothetical protein